MKAVVYATGTGQIERVIEGAEQAIQNERVRGDYALLTDEDTDIPEDTTELKVDPATETFVES